MSLAEINCFDMNQINWYQDQDDDILSIGVPEMLAQNHFFLSPPSLQDFHSEYPILFTLCPLVGLW